MWNLLEGSFELLLVEQGTHDALLALGGRYAQMLTLRASQFVGEVSVPNA